MGAEAKRVLGKSKKRLVVLWRLQRATWRPRSIHIYTLYMGLVHSVLFHAAPA